jgi:8-oxo-dGTP pyrophosphatase MutT (NUDIX family)
MLRFAQNLFDRLMLRLRPPDAQRQVGALPYKVVDGRVTFLLVTSRRSGRWIVPKGSLIKDETAFRSAEIEALEEAGVEGVIDRTPIGSYRTVKKGGIASHVVEVDLYPLRVTKQHDSWLEKGKRHRLWVSLNKAKRLLSDPVLAHLVTELNRRILGDSPTASQRVDP